MRNQRDPKSKCPTNDELNQLPDKASLNAIQQALWTTDEHRGAAVMIGAGLTRTANRAANNAPLPPLWTDLVRKIEEDLYSTAEHKESNPLALIRNITGSA